MEIRAKLAQAGDNKQKYKCMKRTVNEGVNKDTVAILKTLVKERRAECLNWDTLEAVSMACEYDTV